MSIFSGLFRSRDKPTNATSGSSYRIFTGGSTSGKRDKDGFLNGSGVGQPLGFFAENGVGIFFAYLL